MFEDKHVAAAIARLTTMSTASIHDLKERASTQQLEALVVACDEELALRPIAFSANDAASHARMAEAVVDLDLVDTIAVAFSKVLPANEVEIELLRWIAANPGATYQDAVTMRGKGDVGLIIGHLVYERFGCFRRFVKPKSDLSSLLINKDRSGPSVRYSLNAEALEGLTRASVI